MNENNFFMPISNTKPHLKMCFLGEPGSGKSWTTALFAIGLHKRLGSTKPIAILDSEKASKFLVNLFKEHGIEAIVKETQSLADYKTAVEMCSNGLSDILLVDSITHFWMDFLEAYKRKFGRTLLQISDWMAVKADWNKNFTQPLVQSPLNIIGTGRVSDRLEQELNEDTGKKEFTKTGVKIQAEKNVPYDFDAIILMERHEIVLKKKREVWRQSLVLKGRGSLLDGAVFKNPTFADFAPLVDAVLANPDFKNTEQADAGVLMADNAKQDKADKEILLESIKNTLMIKWPSREQADNIAKVKAIEAISGKLAWSAVEAMTLDELKSAESNLSIYLSNLEKTVEAKPKA